MKKSKFTDQQIAFALKQAETGTPVEEVCRKLGISQQTFYRWKKKFAGLGTEEHFLTASGTENGSRSYLTHTLITPGSKNGGIPEAHVGDVSGRDLSLVIYQYSFVNWVSHRLRPRPVCPLEFPTVHPRP
jgi:hypothetical protein